MIVCEEADSYDIVVYSIRHHLPSALTTSLNIFPSAFTEGNEETSRSLYSRIPAYDWTASRLAGLHSTLFDIEANVRDLDDRTGLEGAGAAEVHRLMQTHGVVSLKLHDIQDSHQTQ